MYKAGLRRDISIFSKKKNDGEFRFEFNPYVYNNESVFRQRNYYTIPQLSNTLQKCTQFCIFCKYISRTSPTIILA